MIRIRPSGRQAPANPVISVLVALQRAGVPIDTVCGGRAQCGRCLIRVLAGREKMNPVGEAEAARLAALGAAPDQRLACQSYTRGDLSIEIMNPGPEGRPTAR